MESIDMQTYIRWFHAICFITSGFFLQHVWKSLTVKYGNAIPYLYDWKIQIVPLAFFTASLVKLFEFIISPIVFTIGMTPLNICIVSMSYWFWKFHKQTV